MAADLAEKTRAVDRQREEIQSLRSAGNSLRTRISELERQKG